YRLLRNQSWLTFGIPDEYPPLASLAGEVAFVLQNPPGQPALTPKARDPPAKAGNVWFPKLGKSVLSLNLQFLAHPKVGVHAKRLNGDSVGLWIASLISEQHEHFSRWIASGCSWKDRLRCPLSTTPPALHDVHPKPSQSSKSSH